MQDGGRELQIIAPTGATKDDSYCVRCKKWKPRVEFHTDRGRAIGVQRYCKECDQALYFARAERQAPPPPPGGIAEKQCVNCARTGQGPKPVSKFGRSNKTADGYQHWCRECQNSSRKLMRTQAREIEHTITQAHAQGLTGMSVPQIADIPQPAVMGGDRPRPRLNRSQYDALLMTQRGVCAICTQTETMLTADGTPSKLVYYYAVRDGMAIRLLLCHLCNFGVSFFRDSPILLARATAVLSTGLGGQRVEHEAKLHHQPAPSIETDAEITAEIAYEG